MSKVRILISYKGEPDYYMAAVEAAGAEPVAIQYPQVDTGYDGLLLAGGGDIDPARYGEAVAGSVRIDPERDAAEFALLEAYIKAGKPVLGICRGHQLINVYFGGSLYQHLPETPQHTNKTEHYLIHQVGAEENSVVGKLYGTEFVVNSSHHQAVDRLGDGLHATALWNGQYVEAIEHETLPILGVQWHPEKMCAAGKREDTADGLPILKHFVSMCKP